MPPVFPLSTPITSTKIRDQPPLQFMSAKQECDKRERTPDSDLRIRPPDSDLRIRPPDSDLQIRLPDTDLRILTSRFDLQIPPPNPKIQKFAEVTLNDFKLNFKLRM